VQDGNVITSRGPGTSLAFALALVERLSGAETAKTTAERLLFNPAG
jgi:transcriptional regulator GlxA family with amidase domain